MKKKIIIGITGSIAAFKVIQYISDLIKEGYDVEVMLTKSASQFVTPTSITALTKKKVYIDVFDDDPHCITHVDLVKDADLFMVVPASATTIAKLANGIADNMLTAAYLAATCKKLIAPAMNVNMYENKATQRNIQQLKEDGALFVEPAVGLLACGDQGKGKLADYEHLHLMMEYAMHDHPLQGESVLISAGATMESIDPVRYITNHSTGKMGFAIAKIAFLSGAKVKVISAKSVITDMPYVEVEHVENCEDMLNAFKRDYENYDYIIKAAAVSDYRLESISDQKIKKHDEKFSLSFVKNPDILAFLGDHKKSHQILCGFAMETEDLIENAKLKLKKKHCDMIVANNLKTPGAGFSHDTNVAAFIKQDEIREYPLQSKEALAECILKELKEMRLK